MEKSSLWTGAVDQRPLLRLAKVPEIEALRRCVIGFASRRYLGAGYLHESKTFKQRLECVVIRCVQ